MARYVDGFVLPLPKKNVASYLGLARKAAKVWREHGALEYREALGDDLNFKMGTSFPKATKSKSNETVVFAWIVYKSRKHRDAVNAKVMQDPRILSMIKPGKPMPFDMKRMQMGGFKIAVDS